MSEENFKYPSADIITGQQYELSSYGVDARALLYRYSRPFVDIWKKMSDELELNGDETILDVGSGHSRWVRDLALSGHRGKLFPINNTDISLAVQFDVQSAGTDNITFVISDARELYWPNEEGVYTRIPDESADVVSAQFLLYHVDRPDEAMDEFYRVLKPGGKLLVSTRSNLNHVRLWDYSRQLAGELERMSVAGETEDMNYKEIVAPPSWYPHFNYQDIEAHLNGRYDTMKHFRQKNPEYELQIRDLPHHAPGEAWMEYSLALSSLKDSFFKVDTDPENQQGIKNAGIRPSHWKAAVERIVKPCFEAEVERNGYFRESVDQGFYIAIKK